MMDEAGFWAAPEEIVIDGETYNLRVQPDDSLRSMDRDLTARAKVGDTAAAEALARLHEYAVFVPQEALIPIELLPYEIELQGDEG